MKCNNTMIRWSAAALAAATLLSTQAFAAQPSDAWLTTKVKTELLTDDVVNGFRINVDTFDGRVTLSGKVATDAQKAKAEHEVRSVEGVADVRNLLVVVPEAALEATKIEDAAIETAVKAALAKDARLADSSIDVKSVNQGVVLLSGTASSLTSHEGALRSARGIDGVTRVASEIQSPDELADSEIWDDGKHDGALAGTKATAYDTWLTTKAKVKLMATPGISPMSVNVDTRDGVVTLFGTVGTAGEKSVAAAEVAKLDGVKSVTNELQVVPDVAAAKVSDTDAHITAAVEMRLDQRGALADSDLKVATANGVVRLTGSAARPSDRLTALTVARGTPGVKSVIDDMSTGSGN